MRMDPNGDLIPWEKDGGARLSKRTAVILSSAFCLLLAMIWYGKRQDEKRETIIQGYDPGRDNRFAGWFPMSPGAATPNEHFHWQADQLTGLGWDKTGVSYALIDTRFALSGHASPPGELWFRGANGLVHHRIVVSSQDLLPEETTLRGFGMKLLRLDSALPDDVRPLRIWMAPSAASMEGKKVMILGKHGRAGWQRIVSVKHGEHTAGAVVIFTDVTDREPGTAKCNFGDSNGAVLLDHEGEPMLTGIINGFAVKGRDHSAISADRNIHLCVQPYTDVITAACRCELPMPDIPANAVQQNALSADFAR